MHHHPSADLLRGSRIGGWKYSGSGANLVYNPAALPTTLREDTGSVRIDYNVSDKDRIAFRYNINDSLTRQTIGLNQGQVAPQALRTQLVKLDETHTFSQTFLIQIPSIKLRRSAFSRSLTTPRRRQESTP